MGVIKPKQLPLSGRMARSTIGSFAGSSSTARSSESFIGATHRARLSRLDKGRAIKATAYQLARLIYALLTEGTPYVEKGIEHFESARRKRRIRALQRNARQLGFSVQQNPIASVG